jgi:hypothetical protein
MIFSIESFLWFRFYCIACKELEGEWIGIELEEKWVGVARE